MRMDGKNMLILIFVQNKDSYMHMHSFIYVKKTRSTVLQLQQALLFLLQAEILCLFTQAVDATINLYSVQFHCYYNPFLKQI